MSKIIKIATWNIGQDLKNNQINKDSYKYIKRQIQLHIGHMIKDLTYLKLKK